MDRESEVAGNNGKQNIAAMTIRMVFVSIICAAALAVQGYAQDAATVAQAAVDARFAAMKGCLPMPVGNGTIASRFGRYPNRLAPKVIEEHYGMEIQTQPGTEAMSVFDGEVVSVFTVAESSVVIVRHGSFFSVYNNLAAVCVAKGQVVKAGDGIGVVDINDDGQPAMQFQLWKAGGKKGNKMLDPEYWLAVGR